MIPSGARVWIAMGHTDMRKGMQGLALQVQQGLKRDPHGGDLFVFRGRTGSLVKIIWHDGIGMSLYAKRLEKGRFVWPSAREGIVSLTNAQLRSEEHTSELQSLMRISYAVFCLKQHTSYFLILY